MYIISDLICIYTCQRECSAHVEAGKEMIIILNNIVLQEFMVLVALLLKEAVEREVILSTVRYCQMCYNTCMGYLLFSDIPQSAVTDSSTLPCHSLGHFLVLFKCIFHFAWNLRVIFKSDNWAGFFLCNISALVCLFCFVNSTCRSNVPDHNKMSLSKEFSSKTLAKMI